LGKGDLEWVRMDAEKTKKKKKGRVSKNSSPRHSPGSQKRTRLSEKWKNCGSRGILKGEPTQHREEWGENHREKITEPWTIIGRTSGLGLTQTEIRYRASRGDI